MLRPIIAIAAAVAVATAGSAQMAAHPTAAQPAAKPAAKPAMAMRTTATHTTKTGKTITYDCTKKGNANKKACKK